MQSNCSLESIMTNVDSYKVSMPDQYPPGTSNIFSHVLSRGGRYPATMFFNLQGYVKEYLLVPITLSQIDFAEMFWKMHGEPFDRRPWDIVLNEYAGYLPLTICAAPEGEVIPTGNILVSVELTEDDERLRGLPTWVETSLLRAVWYGTTIATVSWSIRQVIMEYLEQTGDVSGLPFKLHDFGARGVSSEESCRIGSAAHLATGAMGTDSVSGIFYLNQNYNAPLETIGFSIPASEHSTITSWGREGEKWAYKNMVEKFAKPGAVFACVSDSYSIKEACKMWLKLRDQILESGATLVIRPDSGDPCTIIPAILSLLEHGFTDENGTWEGFPCTVNAKGFKILQQVRVIWGDGINELTIRSILTKVVDLGRWSADMLAFGMGGALLQASDRDTQKFAMKCSAAKVNGVWVDVYKDPVTDPGKKSMAGRLALMKATDGSWFTGREDWPQNYLAPVYVNGKLMRDMTLEEIRANANK